MRERIVEIAEDGRYLHAKDGFLVVSSKGDEVGRVPLDDIAGVVGTARGITFSRGVIDALATRGANLVLCGANFSPVACLVPMVGHNAQGERIRAQARATQPQKKRTWQSVVRSKLLWQASALASVGAPAQPLATLAGRVRSGDPSNMEAQGAKRYWPLMYGPAFRRDADAPGRNSALNYGYAVLRSAAARSIAGAGLHPGLGIFHSSHKNPLPLADDLMEPFRPIVDAVIGELFNTDDFDLGTSDKQAIVRVLFMDVDTDRGTTPVITCMQRLASSLAEVYLGEREDLDLPPAPSPPLFAQRIREICGHGDADGIPDDVDDGDV